jgi:hypothetical protein
MDARSHCAVFQRTVFLLHGIRISGDERCGAIRGRLLQHKEARLLPSQP